MEKNKNINDARATKQYSPLKIGVHLIDDPENRLRWVSNCASAVDIDPNIPLHRYFRSGIEMIRMAEVYMKEGSPEKAYIIYVKYLTLFLEKITKHPQYSSYTAKNKANNVETIRKTLSIVEELKNKLLSNYKNELIKYNAEKKNDGDDVNSQSKHEQIPQLPSDNADKFIPNPSWRKDELRDVVVPTKLISELLNFASSNTISNKETCGILAGKLEMNKLLVTHLVIPKQSGSSDSCLTHNEEEIFDYQDQHNLITLGWIHTHPTQTAFLSSVDLHTHCSYQLMMSEAIAIVCAPKYNETGYFTLTPEHGINVVARCRATGFHPHPNEKSLYTHAQHCKLDPIANVIVIDLTKK